MHAGSCLCGAVRYEIDGPFTMMVHCHCSMCRKHHGAMFATFAAAPAASFRWKSGEDHIERFASSANGQRSFCRACGSVVPMLPPGMDMAIVPAGNLEGDPGLRPQLHVFAASRAPWYPITDQLAQHAGFPPEYGGGMGVDRPAPKLREGVVQGSCLCGDMAWEVEGTPERVMNCHCSRCRRARGTAHATNAFFSADRFRWVRGEDKASSYAVPGAKFFTQSFCRRCGSKVPRVMAANNRVMIPCGGLDSSPGMDPAGNIFVANKAPWFEISDGRPQWEAYPAPG